MERYTTKSAVIRGEYRVSPATTENCIEAINKLGRYEDEEEKGLLVHLPCKVGDTIYVPLCGVEEWRVQGISLSYVSNGEICSIPLNILNNTIGQYAFLTCEEAEQALKARDSK